MQKNSIHYEGRSLKAQPGASWCPKRNAWHEFQLSALVVKYIFLFSHIRSDMAIYDQINPYQTRSSLIMSDIKNRPYIFISSHVRTFFRGKLFLHFVAIFFIIKFLSVWVFIIKFALIVITPTHEFTIICWYFEHIII